MVELFAAAISTDADCRRAPGTMRHRIASPHARNVAPSPFGGCRPRRQDFHLLCLRRPSTNDAEGLSESPSFEDVSDRMSGLLVYVGASAIQMQHAPIETDYSDKPPSNRTNHSLVSGSTGRQREKKLLFSP